MSVDFQQKLQTQKTNSKKVHRRLSLWLSVIASAITIYYCAFYFYVGITLLSWLACLSAVIYIVLGVAVFKGANLFLVFRIYIITTFVAFWFEILYTGGVNSSVIPHLIYVPLLSLFYGKRADLIAFFTLTLVSVLGLFFYQYVLEIPLPSLVPEGRLSLIFNLTNYLFILFAVIPIAFLFKLEIRKANKSLKQSLKEQRETYQQLVHSEKLASIGQLTAGVAHEVNNPANFLQLGAQQLSVGFAEMKAYGLFQEELFEKVFMAIEKEGFTVDHWKKQINEKKSDFHWEELQSETETNLEILREGASRIVEIVRSLNTFSRKDEVFAGSYSIHQGIESTLLLLRNEWHHRIEIQKEFGDVPEIECNPGNINQVLLNLISNAIQAIAEQGEISIATTHHPEVGTISVRISDSGTGISEAHLGSIFEPFYTTKDEGKGTGLGLAISKQIVENHGGRLTVSSTVGQGSTFVVTLPVRQTETGLLGESEHLRQSVPA